MGHKKPQEGSPDEECVNTSDCDSWISRLVVAGCDNYNTSDLTEEIVGRLVGAWILAVLAMSVCL